MIEFNLDYVIEKINNGVTLVKNFFIDETIIINDNADFLDNAKQYILKYRRVIAVILLLILLLIPLCYDSDGKINQSGGAADAPAPETKSDAPKTDATAAATKAEAAVAATEGKQAEIEKQSKAVSHKSRIDKIQGKYQDYKKKDEETKAKLKQAHAKIQEKGGYAKVGAKTAGKKIGKGVLKVGDKLTSKKAWKSAGASSFKFGSDMADRFKANSSVIYRLIYMIAFTLLIAIVFLPSIGFFIVGIICYFILQKRINYIKAL